MHVQISLLIFKRPRLVIKSPDDDPPKSLFQFPTMSYLDRSCKTLASKKVVVFILKKLFFGFVSVSD